jgi:hypothetical protein
MKLTDILKEIKIEKPKFKPPKVNFDQLKQLWLEWEINRAQEEYSNDPETYEEYIKEFTEKLQQIEDLSEFKYVYYYLGWHSAHQSTELFSRFMSDTFIKQ